MNMSQSFPHNDPLARFGLCSFAPRYSAQDILEFNEVLDPLLKSRSDQARAYVHIDELNSLGLLQRLFSPAMRQILFSIMPDPVLFHCLVNEIAANDTRPHFGGDRMSGWHRDLDSEWVPGEVTHVSIFTYLTDVGPEDGAFEFAPKKPRWLNSTDPTVLVTGQTGTTFAWQRSFFHRASPNRGPRRRRLFKISVQRNRFPSHHLSTDHFRAAVAAIPPGDIGMDVLLGRYQGGEAPAVEGFAPLPQSIIPPTGTVNVPISELVPEQLRDKAREVKDGLRAVFKGRPPASGETY